MTPNLLQTLTLTLATYRTTRLIGWDDMPLILQARNHAIQYNPDTQTVGRPKLWHFLTCGYCLGFWVTTTIYTTWLLWPRATLYTAIPLAISGAVGLIVKHLDA